MKQYVYKTHGTCSQFINYEVDDNGRIHYVQFAGGCDGNLQGIARLVEGMTAHEVIDKLRGIRCGYKETSCPDQLAAALSQYVSSSNV